MKIIIVLVVIGSAIADGNVRGDTEETTTGENDVTVTVTSLERHSMRPIFPKSVEKIIMTTKSSTVANETTPVIRLLKKPVFKIVQKAVKMKSKNYWKTATRRPSLMKYTKFTIDPLTTYNKNRTVNANKQSEREHRRKYNINQFRKTMRFSNDDDSSEEDLVTSTAKQQHKDKIKHVKTLIRRFHKLGSKVNKENNVENISKFNERVKMNRLTDKPGSDEFSSDENEDRQEFIFVTPKIIQKHIIKAEEDSAESDEATTMVFERELKLRRKRSINVIEEENLGTTVSGFKFTGKVNSLSSNLVFRNINT